MANELTYTGIVENGVLKITNRKIFDSDLKSFEGQRLVIKIKKYRKSRSLPQNNYYWGCVIPAVQHGLLDVGVDKRLTQAENVHDMLRDMFLKETVGYGVDGNCIPMIRSTSDLTTTEFMDYVAEIQKWGSEFLNIYIADPNEQTKINY